MCYVDFKFVSSKNIRKKKYLKVFRKNSRPIFLISKTTVLVKCIAICSDLNKGCTVHHVPHRVNLTVILNTISVFRETIYFERARNSKWIAGEVNKAVAQISSIFKKKF